mmetsp:Transcript_89804/g.161992  ORF Transcript_89804/g.161992 Transcript_89804/m.161992 type:complete len:244 (+) Transcript_89804:887-1618(+)
MPRDLPATSVEMAPTATNTSRKLRAHKEARIWTSPCSGQLGCVSLHCAPFAALEGSVVATKGSPLEARTCAGTSAASADQADSRPPSSARSSCLLWSLVKCPRPSATALRALALPMIACAPTSMAAAAAASAKVSPWSCRASSQHLFLATWMLTSLLHRSTSSREDALTAMTTASWLSSSLSTVPGSPKLWASVPTASQAPLRVSVARGFQTQRRVCSVAGASKAAMDRPSMLQPTLPLASRA